MNELLACGIAQSAEQHAWRIIVVTSDAHEVAPVFDAIAAHAVQPTRVIRVQGRPEIRFLHDGRIRVVSVHGDMRGTAADAVVLVGWNRDDHPHRYRDVEECIRGSKLGRIIHAEV